MNQNYPKGIQTKFKNLEIGQKYVVADEMCRQVFIGDFKVHMGRYGLFEVLLGKHSTDGLVIRADKFFAIEGILSLEDLIKGEIYHVHNITTGSTYVEEYKGKRTSGWYHFEKHIVNPDDSVIIRKTTFEELKSRYIDTAPHLCDEVKLARRDNENISLGDLKAGNTYTVENLTKGETFTETFIMHSYLGYGIFKNHAIAPRDIVIIKEIEKNEKKGKEKCETPQFPVPPNFEKLTADTLLPNHPTFWCSRTNHTYTTHYHYPYIKSLIGYGGYYVLKSPNIVKGK